MAQTWKFSGREAQLISIRHVVLLALVCMVPVHEALAQKKMYRCGSNYQDRPCDAAPPAAAPAGAAKSAAPVQAVSAPAESAADKKAAFQRQVRCENYGRQMDELRLRQKGMQEGAMLEAQIKALDSRMKGDSC